MFKLNILKIKETLAMFEIYQNHLENPYTTIDVIFITFSLVWLNCKKYIMFHPNAGKKKK